MSLSACTMSSHATRIHVRWLNRCGLLRTLVLCRFSCIPLDDKSLAVDGKLARRWYFEASVGDGQSEMINGMPTRVSAAAVALSVYEDTTVAVTSIVFLLDPNLYDPAEHRGSVVEVIAMSVGAMKKDNCACYVLAAPASAHHAYAIAAIQIGPIMKHGHAYQFFDDLSTLANGERSCRCRHMAGTKPCMGASVIEAVRVTGQPPPAVCLVTTIGTLECLRERLPRLFQGWLETTHSNRAVCIDELLCGKAGVTL